MDFRRVNGTSDENIVEFFERLQLDELKHIPPEHIWNVDEGISVQQQWFPEEGESVGNEDDEAWHDWLFTASPNGWTSNELALLWLKEIFIPGSMPEKEGQWRLLILDGHASHTTTAFMITCLEHKIWVLYLLAHTSHVLQPLDQAPFSVLKRRFRTEVTIRCQLNFDMNVTTSDFIWAWNRARQKAFNPYNMASAWKATGIWPRDINKPLNNRLRRLGGFDEEMTSSQESASSQHTLDGSGTLTTPQSSRQVREIQSALVEGRKGSITPRHASCFGRFGRA
ncbi:transposase [Apiospora phragmitis]|uniref:Transposase n=1 Tax=Apiospora phragmitis TaxID=2905665 RepID=A0ABR1SVL5_9PEZI